MATPRTNNHNQKSRPSTKEIKTSIRQATEIKGTRAGNHKGNTPRTVSNVPVHSLGTIHGTVIENEFNNSEHKDSARATVSTNQYQTENGQKPDKTTVSNNTSKTNQSSSKVNKISVNRETTQRVTEQAKQMSQEAPQMNYSHLETPVQGTPHPKSNSESKPLNENHEHHQQSQTNKIENMNERNKILRQTNLRQTVKAVPNDPKRADDIKEDMLRQSTEVKASSSHPNTEMVPSRSIKANDNYNISRLGTEVKQNSSRTITQNKQNSSRQSSEMEHSSSRPKTGIKHNSSRTNMEVKQNSTRQNTEVKQNNTRQNTEVKQNNTRPNTELKHNSTRQNTEVKQNNTRPNTELKHKSTRQNTEVKQNNTRPNTELRHKSSRPISEVKQNNSRSNTEVNKQRQMTDKTPSIPHENFEANTELRRNSSTQYIRNQILPNEKEDASSDRQVTPYNTSFSPQRTRAESSSSKGVEAVEKKDQNPHQTSIVPSLALMSSPGPTHPDTIENVSLTELKQSMSGASQCPYCDMTFTSPKLLQFHKAKFCIANPLAQDVYTLIDTREFFTIGGSGIIHSTPRAWHVAGITPVKYSRDYTLGDNQTKFSKFHWDKCFNGKVPEFAVKAGFDQSAGCSIYVCRAKVDKELVPGKVVPANGCAYVSTGGQEHLVTHYEVLTDPHELLSWQHTDVPGGIPRGAHKGGHDASDLVYFIARALAPDGNMCCGKYVPQDMKCYFSWHGQEISTIKFEFLCKKLHV